MARKEKIAVAALAFVLSAQPTHSNSMKAFQPTAPALRMQYQTSDTYEAVRSASRDAVATALNDLKKKTDWIVKVKEPLSGDLHATMHNGPQVAENYYFDATTTKLVPIDFSISIEGNLKDKDGKDTLVKTNFAVILGAGGARKLIYTDYATSDITALDTSDSSLVQIANSYKGLWDAKKTDGKPKIIVMQENKMAIVQMERKGDIDVADVIMCPNPASCIEKGNTGTITLRYQFNKDNMAVPYTEPGQ